MRLGLRLCVLMMVGVQLWAPGLGQEPDGQEQVLVFCDDPDVGIVVDKALVKYNQLLPQQGNKLALYQILEASNAKNDSGSLYTVKFNGRETNCPAQGDKPWNECDYLSMGHAVPTACNATVYVTELGTDVLTVFCDLMEPLVVPVRDSPCLGCPEEIDVESEDLKTPLSFSLTRYNSISDSSHHFVLNSLGFATRQVVAGFRYQLKFDMRKSNCSKTDYTDATDECHPDANDVELANCNSTVDVAPWRHETPEANVECEAGPLPPTLFSRRRPPGWSPLRSVVDFKVQPKAPPTTAAAPTAAASPTAKEGSSEESKEKSTPSDSPMHCPTKPWKPFVPQTIPILVATMSAPAEDPTSSVAVEEGFLDTDMLG